MAFVRNVLALVLIVSLCCEVSLAATYNVGDSCNWTVGCVDYDKWVSSKRFYVGDIIVFNYSNQYHNVLQVSHKDYKTCYSFSPKKSYNTGYDAITFKEPGHYFYICGFPGHCGELGQKVAITVTLNSSSPGATPSPSPSPGPSPAHRSSAGAFYSSSLLLALSALLFAV